MKHFIAQIFKYFDQTFHKYSITFRTNDPLIKAVSSFICRVLVLDLFAYLNFLFLNTRLLYHWLVVFWIHFDALKYNKFSLRIVLLFVHSLPRIYSRKYYFGVKFSKMSFHWVYMQLNPFNPQKSRFKRTVCVLVCLSVYHLPVYLRNEQQQAFYI